MATLKSSHFMVLIEKLNHLNNGVNNNNSTIQLPAEVSPEKIVELQNDLNQRRLDYIALRAETKVKYQDYDEFYKEANDRINQMISAVKGKLGLKNRKLEEFGIRPQITRRKRKNNNPEATPSNFPA
ncbi:MAG: hypothetical protein Q8N03_07315 [Ignavibacteria bacterium]|nr:hypothetical protein [Ignavibacteria bacterium]